MSEIRTFNTGANRDTDNLKNDYEGYLSPLVIKAFGDYMTKHRKLPNGDIRESDNWQKLFGTYEEHKSVCIKSAFRHFLDWWLEYDGYKSRDGLDEALCGLLFNVMAYYHCELLEREKND